MTDKTNKKSDPKPFLEREHPCPVCGKSSNHRYLKDQVYSVIKRDEDFFISQYQWVTPEYNQYNLYHFYLWHCIYCKFTEERSFFLKSHSNYTEHQIALLKSFKNNMLDNPIIQGISEYIHYPNVTHISVIALHLLALYIQQIPDTDGQNLEKIAMFYHRTAWMYRLQKQDETLQDISTLLSKFNQRYENFQSGFLKIFKEFELFHHWINKNIVFQDTKNFEEEKYNSAPVQNLPIEFKQNLQDNLKTLQNYYKSTVEYYEQLNTNKKNESAYKSSLYQKFQDLVIQLRNLWPEIAVSKQSAIQHAIENYQKIIDSNLLDTDFHYVLETLKPSQT